jgi:type II secretory pathway predicted ATPase ExeA
MSHSHIESTLESPSPSSLSGVAEPPPFHNNLHYQEVLGTLRYGIIARKGLILLIGDAGVGKTTMLHQLAGELAANVTCIFESDPETNFTDLLRLILGHLENSSNSSNSLSMMGRCKAILSSQLERGRIVCLMIDNAERLRDESLEYLLHNFYSPAPAEGDENLLQIVLAGRPELREKPRLSSLKLRSEIVCQLQPLRHKDIAGYLKTRLRAAQLAEETFDSGAIDRIAVYAGGNPHLINAISNRALQVSKQSRVTAEMVARAAEGLNLPEARRLPGETTKQNLETASESEAPIRLADGDAMEVEGQLRDTFDSLNPPAPTRSRNAFRLVLILLLLAGAAAWLQTERGKTELSKWFGKPREAVDSQPRIESNTGASVAARQAAPALPAPEGEFSSPTISASATSPSLPVAEESVEIPSTETKKGTGKNSPANDPRRARKAPPPKSNDRQTALAPDASAQRKLLETKVHKAIENRAITGVDVAVIRGTAFLKGGVATDQQKDAAERAARSVPGVERVDNQIAVGS